MNTPLANFDQNSPLSTSPHDPKVSLASNCIRDYFGPTVQMVADCLQFREEPTTFNELVNTLRQKCRQKVYSQERIRLLGKKVAARLQNQSMQLPPLRAALLVLVQHSLVKVTVSKVKGKPVYRYQFDGDRARMMPRYPRYVEYAKKALDDKAGALVEELLVQGRMRTVDAVKRTVEQIKIAELATSDANEEPQANPTNNNNNNNTSSRYTSRQAVLESFKRLTQAGFLEQVPKLVDPDELTGVGVEEFEFEPKEPPKKRVKFQDDRENQSGTKSQQDEDPAIVNLLQGGAYKDILPRDAVWRVNINMFHDSLRAFILGRLVAERYGHRVQSAGSMVTAALKFLAHRKHAEKNNDVEMTFTAADIIRYIPKAVLQLLEKKRKESLTNKGTTVVTSVARSLQQLSKFIKPLCVMEVEVGAKPEHSKFEIYISRLVQYLQRRIVHQVIYDSHGEVASRIVTILSLNGYLESDSLADAAMVPAKDIREV